VRDILLKRAAAARITSRAASGSPRMGCGRASSRGLHGRARDEQVMDHTRHRDLKTMRGYVRRAKLVTESATKLLDL
jgi:hypothetical protein